MIFSPKSVEPPLRRRMRDDSSNVNLKARMVNSRKTLLLEANVVKLMVALATLEDDECIKDLSSSLISSPKNCTTTEILSY